MLFVKAFHIIAMVAWFSGLFYLPRLFVYHVNTFDALSIARFKIMEQRLYYGITWPAAVLTTGLGIWLITYNVSYYLKTPWMHIKLGLVLLVWIYHFSCGYFLRKFRADKHLHSVLFFRIFNEMPIFLLVGIIILVVVKPL